MQTEQQYKEIVTKCRTVFQSKLTDYGPSWLVFRLSSLTDQILIKALRVRSLENKNDRALISDDRASEFIGIVNYSVIALMRIWCGEQLPKEFEVLFQTEKLDGTFHHEILDCYDRVTGMAFELMLKKNHDYDEAWRSMLSTSMTDQILVKLSRLRQIEQNDGRVLQSEGIDSQYCDILNYAIFSLILLGEHA